MALGLLTPPAPLEPPSDLRRYLGDDLWRGDHSTDEGAGGLGRAVGNGAGAVQHKVLLDSGCQILIPARLGRQVGLLREVATVPSPGGRPRPPALGSTSKVTLILLATMDFPGLARITVVLEAVVSRQPVITTRGHTGNG